MEKLETLIMAAEAQKLAQIAKTAGVVTAEIAVNTGELAVNGIAKHDETGAGQVAQTAVGAVKNVGGAVKRTTDFIR